MSEVVSLLESEKVASVFSRWLQEEIFNSDEGHNAILSDYAERRADLFKPTNDDTNMQYQKAISHYGRFKLWLDPYKETASRGSDYFVGRLIFACLMEVSGSFRKQCFFEASDEADYYKRRTMQGPVGIDIARAVATEFTPDQIGMVEAMGEDERVDYITRRSLMDQDEGLLLHQSIHDWAIQHQVSEGLIATEDNEPVLALKQAQRLYVSLAASHVLIAASFRGNDLAKVPILEPKSITDVSSIPLYPIY